MFSRNMTKQSTSVCSNEITRLKQALAECDTVLIGAGAGLSTAAGLTYSGERFMKNFDDFAEKYHINDMYSGSFYPFESPEEYWAWWSRQIFCNRYSADENGLYKRLLEIVRDKDYFVITTNVDHQFQLAGFDKSRLFYTQGDYGLFQCSVPCHNATYSNETAVREMIARQKDMKIPAELIPVCPECGKPMTVNLRSDDRFAEDEGWHRAYERYSEFIRTHRDSDILLLELGVGFNTPVIIKYPFWKITAQNPDAVYACINYGEAFCPDEIAKQSICINDDIFNALNEI